MQTYQCESRSGAVRPLSLQTQAPGAPTGAARGQASPGAHFRRGWYTTGQSPLLGSMLSYWPFNWSSHLAEKGGGMSLTPRETASPARYCPRLGSVGAYWRNEQPLAPLPSSPQNMITASGLSQLASHKHRTSPTESLSKVLLLNNPASLIPCYDPNPSHHLSPRPLVVSPPDASTLPFWTLQPDIFKTQI